MPHMPYASSAPERSIERTSIELPVVVDDGCVYSVRAFGELGRLAGYAAWLQFQLNAPGHPTISTEPRRVASAIALARWARGLAHEQLQSELFSALTRWKRSRPFQPRLIKTTGPVMAHTGALYDARIFCEQDGHIWVGWLEFQPRGDGPTWVTGHETSHSSLPGVVYWVQGLEGLYFQGALDRARWWASLSDAERARQSGS
jgi:hypothetical protein